MTQALWVTDEHPDVRGHGGSVRQGHLLGALRSALPVEVVEVAPPNAQAQPRSRGRLLWHLLTHRDPTEIEDGVGARNRLRSRLAGREAVDVVVVNHVWLGPLVNDRGAGERWVLDAHNLPSIKAGHAATTAGAPQQRWRWRREAGKAETAEARLADAYDLVVVPSDGDARALRAGQVEVVPNGVDPDRFPASPLPEGPRIVFTGSLDYRPNIDGVRWLVGEIWPRIRARRPEAVLEVVGFRPVASVRELDAAPGVTVIGDVPDTVPFLHRARVSVVPLRIGSGTRLKALEAMACSRPVVGTAIGLEGLDVRDGEHALVAETPAEFADAVVTLLEDDDRARALAAAGRTHVLAHFTWDRVGKRFVEVVTQDVSP